VHFAAAVLEGKLAGQASTLVQRYDPCAVVATGQDAGKQIGVQIGFLDVRFESELQAAAGFLATGNETVGRHEALDQKRRFILSSGMGGKMVDPAIADADSIARTRAGA
jgi:hypothetical protein